MHLGARRLPDNERSVGQPINVLINNAGTAGSFEGQVPAQFDETVFEEVLRVNALAALLVSSTSLDHVKASHQNKIVAIVSPTPSAKIYRWRSQARLMARHR